MEEGVPHFPLPTRRLLNGDTSIAVTYVVFDLLEVDPASFASRPVAAGVGDSAARMRASSQCPSGRSGLRR